MPSVISLNDTEHILVADAFTGNRQAFGKLYSKYAPLLLGCILKTVPDRKLAENILQYSFIEIWKNKHKYNVRSGCLFTWMYSITKKNALHFVNNRHKNAGGEISKAFGIVNSSNNLKKKDFLCDSETINENESDEVHKMLFEVMYFNGHSLKDVSVALNIGEDKLKVMLRCAVKRFKTLPR